MKFQCIISEWMKLRRSMIWLILFLLPLLAACFGAANYYNNTEILQNQWYSLWSQMTLFYCFFFFPVQISICAAYLCRLENSNKNWNKLLTVPISFKSIFFSKLLVLTVLSFVVQTWMFLLYIFAGFFVFHFDMQIPYELVNWFFNGLLAAVVIGVLQLFLSMRLKSFAVPVGICICGCVIGLGLYAQGYGMYFPYSLLHLGMGATSQQLLTIAQMTQLAINSFVFIVFFSVWTIRWIKRTDF